MRDTSLCNTSPDPLARTPPSVPRRATSVHQAGRVGGNENQQLRCVAEPEIADGVVGEPIAGNVIDKDAQKGQATKEIEPEVP